VLGIQLRTTAAVAFLHQLFRDLLPFLLPNAAARTSTGQHWATRGAVHFSSIPVLTSTNEHKAIQANTGYACLLIRRAGFETLAAH
jgi:hypothetical protein